MDASSSEYYLQQLGLELQKQGITGEILISGDVIVLLDIHQPKIRRDLDAYLAGNDNALAFPTTIEDYFAGHGSTLLEATQSVAQREQLPDGWLNAAAAGFTYNFIKKPDMILWRAFPGLHVYLPSLEYLFVTKVMAGRRKDDEDIKALARQLHLSTVKDAIQLMLRYVADNDISNESLQAVQRCFSQ